MDNEAGRLCITPGKMGVSEWRDANGQGAGEGSSASSMRERRHKSGHVDRRIGKTVGVRNLTITRLQQGAFAAPRPEKLRTDRRVLGYEPGRCLRQAGDIAPGNMPGFHAYLPAQYHSCQRPPSSGADGTSSTPWSPG